MLNHPRGNGLRVSPWSISICLWIVAACLGPDITLGGSSLKLRPEDILTVAMSGAVLLFLLTRRVPRGTLGVALRIMLLVCGFAITSALALALKTLSGSSPEGMLGNDLVLGILKEIIRFGKYILIAIAFSQVPYRQLNTALVPLMLCCVVLVGIQLIQYFDSARINPWLVDFYGGGAPHASIGYSAEWAKDRGEFRAGSVMINPNVLAAFLIAPFFLCVMRVLESFNATSNSGRRFRPLWLGMIGVTLLGLFLAQSRTVLVATVAGGIISFLFIPQRFRRKFGRIGVLLTPAILTAFIVFAGSTGRFTLEGLTQGLVVDSANIKFTQLLVEIQKLGPLIVVGGGPGSSGLVDSEIGYILTWYGLVGMVIYILFYYSIYRMLRYRIQNVYLRAAFIGIVTAYMIGGVGNSFFLNNRVFPIFIVLLSIACASAIRKPTRVLSLPNRTRLANTALSEPA